MQSGQFGYHASQRDHAVGIGERRQNRKIRRISRLDEEMTSTKQILVDQKAFATQLFSKLKLVHPGIDQMAFYEFRYCLNNITPTEGWESVHLPSIDDLSMTINSRSFYESVKIKEKKGEKILLDPQISTLTYQLFVGLVLDDYSPDWIRTNFYFDLRSFHFFHRTSYFTPKITDHLSGKPFYSFEKKQKTLEFTHEIGYKAFMEANAAVDDAFIQTALQITSKMGTPLIIAIAGPTAAGKTEIVERLSDSFASAGKSITSIELDNFLTDRDYREEKGIFTQGKAALHFELLKNALHDVKAGKRIQIPRYDFIDATSSHDLSGQLKPGGAPITIEPADIIFIEGNFPFLLDEIYPLIGLKVVYLTEDHIRLLRKWRRDIDYRKKYEPTYFRNRFFKDQFIMAEIAYRPQMEVCDIVVDTTQASLWLTKEMRDVVGD